MKNKKIWLVAVLSGLMGLGSARLAQVHGDPASPSLDTQNAKVSYAMGVSMARAFKRPGVDVNVELLAQALRDELVAGKIQMSEADLQKTMLALRVELKQKQAKVLEVTAQANQNKATAFFADNARRQGVRALPSGLQYEVLKAGSNPQMPGASDVVKCHYRGTDLDGHEFESSYARNEPATFRVAGVIPGMQEALKLMPVGSKWRVYVPPALGYGPRGSGAKIQPNAGLIFEIELLEVTKPS